MKRILSLLIMSATLIVGAGFTNQADAQIIRNVTITAADDTLVNADTANVTLTFDGSFKSVEATVLEVDGTTGGKVYFQGELPHGGAWEDLDSLALSDVTTLQYKLFTVPNPRKHKAYRFRFIKSGTGSAAIKGYYLRYTGGSIFRQDPYNGFAWIDKYQPASRFLYVRYLTNLKGDFFRRGFRKPLEVYTQESRSA